MDRLIRLRTLFKLKNVVPFSLDNTTAWFLTGWFGKMESTRREHFSGSNFVSLEWTCLCNRGVPKERYHCIVTTLSPSPPPSRLFISEAF